MNKASVVLEQILGGYATTGKFKMVLYHEEGIFAVQINDSRFGNQAQE
jgi:hypothetical protein